MIPDVASAALNTAALSTPGKKPTHVAEAAQQFEALLLANMLRSMREADSAGWLGTGEDQAGASAMEMAEQQFAEALSSSGGLGLAKLVMSGLAPDQ